ncbi:MAG TPA: response regulator [Humisphaera sp.]
MARVLVVDDNESIQEGLALLLKAHGLTAIRAGDGEEALELLQSQPVDLVVLDLSMPGTDGLMVLEQMREWPETAATPVIVYSAAGDPSTKRQVTKLGVVEFIDKGDIEWDDLAARVLRQLATKGPPAGDAGGYAAGAPVA